MTQVSLFRLYALRACYALIAFGLGFFMWPSILHHDQPWGLMQGVVKAMLGALSLLCLLGLRYPLQMLPLLLFEMAWKVLWLGLVALPAWLNHQLDGDTLETFYECVPILAFFLVIPWRYVVTTYGLGRGERWA